MKTENAFKECEVCGVPNFLHSTYCGWENAAFLAIPGTTIKLNQPPSEKEASWKFWKTLFVPTPALPIDITGDKVTPEEILDMQLSDIEMNAVKTLALLPKIITAMKEYASREVLDYCKDLDQSF